ncbi:hypothetical protein QJQ45_004554 [Haematococcus lacustris]|nr:hypothetical protein QJQ45_004554 [Haematococcus lacustris]
MASCVTVSVALTMVSCAAVSVALTLALRVAVAVVCLWQHRSMVSDVGGSLLEVEVGSGSEWRDAQHPLRVDAAMPVKYVPTVYHYSVAGGAGARISNQLNSDVTVEALRVVVAMFLRDTAGQSKSAVSYAQTVIESKGKKCGGC